MEILIFFKEKLRKNGKQYCHKVSESRMLLFLFYLFQGKSIIINSVFAERQAGTYPWGPNLEQHEME